MTTAHHSHCQICGAQAFNYGQHAEWHRQLEAGYTLMISRIAALELGRPDYWRHADEEATE